MSDGRERGGEVLTGGTGTGERGHFYRPTLLTGLKQDMQAWREETFGPLLSIGSFETEEEAIQLSNEVS